MAFGGGARPADLGEDGQPGFVPILPEIYAFTTLLE
jgi:hypothetical protein